MILNRNICISLNLTFNYTKRRCSLTSLLLNSPSIDEYLSSLKKIKNPESMFVQNNDVASKFLNNIN